MEHINGTSVFCAASSFDFRTKAAAPWCHLICFFRRLLEAPLPPLSPGGDNGPPCPPLLLGSRLWVWTWKGSSPGRSYGTLTAARSLGCRRTGVLCFRNALTYEIGCILPPQEVSVKREICSFRKAKFHFNEDIRGKMRKTAGIQSRKVKTLDKRRPLCYDPRRQGKGVMSNDIPCLFHFYRR